MSESRKVIDHLIISSPFEVPTQHWEQDEQTKTFELRDGRRPAGYYITDPRYGTNRFERLELVNRIRTRVDEWRAADYPGVTAVTRKLLEHWRDRSARCAAASLLLLPDRSHRDADLVGGRRRKRTSRASTLPGDGGVWERLCSKMATGTRQDHGDGA
ncbi:MAG: hypothetical protein MZV70_46820 [Desulfobacterales bacterium]|nr:hypothetical protein [Desulfobacterales bacterium]